VNGSASLLSAWQSYYVIVGSSAGALIGLQFVVITLIAGTRRRTAADTLSAFGTPTVVHFGGALLVSAIMSAPWPSLVQLSVALGLYGLAGLVYGAIVGRRARRQTGYQPVWQDWVWYITLPCASYAALTTAAGVLRTNMPLALFGIGTAALGLLIIGIHNAWDTVTHLVTTALPADETKTG
jgi:hypothetical protein